MEPIPFEIVQKHCTAEDCWVVIHGMVYNLTSFLNEHPGGSRIIIKQAGKDATAAYDQVHPKDMIDRFLPKDCLVGPVDIATLPVAAVAKASTVVLPPLESILNLAEFEKAGEKALTKEAWAYYSSAADDEVTMHENQRAFQRYRLIPRVLINVKNIDISTTLFGTKTSMPIYITATALGKLGHPQGEVVLTRAAGTRNIIQMIPTLASCSLDEIVDAGIDNQTFWFQLYVNSNRNLVKEVVSRAEKRGAKVLCITVDAPILGRREKDLRVKFVEEAPDVGTVTDRSQGAARAISGFIDPSLSWADIPWFRSITKLPIVLKGVHSGQDAVKAAILGIDGIIVSNHGGRQLDTVYSGIEMLEQVMHELRRYGLAEKITVLVDGGFRRGTDIFKALALGAKAVGIGRPFLYAMSGYGQQGVERAIDLLREELELAMRLMGTPNLDQIQERCISAFKSTL